MQQQQWGNGILDKTLFAIPYELHVPGYQFCGPNTKLEERLKRGDTGINGLDTACKYHDIAYAQSNDLKMRHEADKVLAKRALERFHAKNSSWKEKMVALGVAGAMKAKVKLGMGLSTPSRKVSCVKVLNQCEKVLERSKRSLDECLNKISDFKSNKLQTTTTTRKRNPTKRKIRNGKEKLNNDVIVESMMIDNASDEEKTLKKTTKRKLDYVDQDQTASEINKRLKLTPIRKNVSLKRKLEDDDEEEESKRFKFV